MFSSFDGGGKTRMSTNILFERASAAESDNNFFNGRFKRLYNSEVDCDVTFMIRGNSIKGHKLIFSLASEYFYELFHGEHKYASVFEYKADIEPKGFEAMKQFIYTGEVEFKSYGVAIAVLLINSKFRIPQLDLECMKYFKEVVFPSNDILNLHGFLIGFPELASSRAERECRKVIAERASELIKCDNFISAEKPTVNFILQLESLSLNSEIEVFDAFEKWALAEAKRKNIHKSNMTTWSNKLKKHIRFLAMTSKEFASTASKSVLLSKEEKLAIALNLMDLGSTPYPNHLCSIMKNRNSTSDNVTLNQL